MLPRRCISQIERISSEILLPETIQVMSNENNFGPSPAVIEALSSITKEDISRYPDSDCQNLKKSLSKYTGVPSKNIAVFSGGDEAIRTIFSVFLERGKKLISYYPSFCMYANNAKLLGSKFKLIDLSQDFSFDDQVLTETLNEITENSIVIVANPNNPTGCIIQKKNLDRLIGYTKERNIPIIIDEAYYEFSRETYVNHATEKGSNIIIIRSLSKAFGLAGLRLGYLVGSEDIINSVLQAKLTFNVSSISQLLAIKALEEITYMQLCVNLIIEERQSMVKDLLEIGLVPINSRTNFLFFPCPVNMVELLMQSGICAKALYLPGWENKYYCRLSIGTQEENEKIKTAIYKIVFNQPIKT